MLGAVLQKATEDRPKRGRKHIRPPAASLGINVQERIRDIEKQSVQTNTDSPAVQNACSQTSINTQDIAVGGDDPIIETASAETQTRIEVLSKACDTAGLDSYIKEERLRRRMIKQAEIAATQRLVLGAPAGDESDE